MSGNVMRKKKGLSDHKFVAIKRKQDLCKFSCIHPNLEVPSLLISIELLQNGFISMDMYKNHFYLLSYPFFVFS